MFRLSLVIFSLFVYLANAQDVLSLRYGSYPNKERIVLEIGKNTSYKVILLENPKRIVVDVQGVDLQLKENPKIDVKLGKHPWGTRIVINKDYNNVKFFSLSNPFRIVIDIYNQKKTNNKN